MRSVTGRVKVRRSIPLILLLAAFFGWAKAAVAHPHVWVDYYIDAVGGNGGITKVKFRWHFDDMFTSMIKETFHVQTLGPKEIDTLEKGAFSNLKNYHYYIYIKADGVDYEPKDVTSFSAALKDKALEYTFTVPLPKPAKKIEVSLFDPEFYVDIGPPIQPMSADAPGIMAATKMKPKDFLTTSAENGAKAPVCAWHQGEPRVSSTWGKFAVFNVTCDAQ